MVFRNRAEAGKMLAKRLRQYANRTDVVILALPRGGVPVAAVVAEELNAPLDIIIVQKLGAPAQKELAMGAIASGNVLVLNQYVVQELGVSQPEIESAVDQGKIELERRERMYRGDRPPVNVSGRTVILIDDGLATGSSMRAAIEAVRRLGPAKVVVAVPVASESTCEQLENEADGVVCAVTPPTFFAVGQWYQDFSQTTDRQVRQLLDHSAGKRMPRAA